MKTSVIEVRDMLSVLSVQGVEDRIGDVPGVQSVTVNFSAGNATVRYDETRLDSADIKSDVRQRGYDEAAAEPVPAGADASEPTVAKPPDKAAQTAPAPPVPEATAPEHATPGDEKMSMPDKA